MDKLPVLPVSREPCQHLFGIPYRRREPDSLDMTPRDSVETFKENPEMGSSLRLYEGMQFINDDEPGMAEIPRRSSLSHQHLE
ncbi:MAG: hypothetical protein A4E42_00541 [Methanoregulaceae archaeon PtaU1.Bin222]|nr:MAG: hypothetical protein A4E42_00541 [Methanoregulaceae archaeon PtaU1.Bin222]